MEAATKLKVMNSLFPSYVCPSLAFVYIKMVSLMVETDEPQWSVNVKKAIASLIQLDIAGVRSSASETAVFGERDSLLETYEVITILITCYGTNSPSQLISNE